MTAPDFSTWSCPLPLRDYPNVVLGHGGGGKLTAELIEHLFVPAFRDPTLSGLGDSAVLPPIGGRFALTTDCHVVHPLFFPGGSLGELAVHGTVNDLAMVGARPLYLTAGFILEEGLPLDVLGKIVEAMARAARDAGVRVVAGDTKVVEKGRGDGCFITTSGVGVVPEGIHLGPEKARPGDVVLVSGTLGDHGMAVISVREGLEFESVIESDTTSLYPLVADLLAVTKDLHVLRDPTRGGLAAVLQEIAVRSQVGIILEERALPIRPAVQAACEILGLDPIHVANEGKLVCVVPPGHADAILAAMKQHHLGQSAAIIGEVTNRPRGALAMKTRVGGTRVIPQQLGEQLPRIC